MAKVVKGKCGECEHVWIVAHLPIEVSKFAEIGKRAICPKCACKDVYVASDEEKEGD